MACSLSRVVNAVPYIPDNPVDELTGIVFEDSSGLPLNTDIFNSQSNSDFPLSSPGTTDLFPESTEDNPTLSLANSGLFTDDQTNGDIFLLGDHPDANGLELDEMSSSFQQADTEPNTGPCDKNLLNLCCTDTRYQDVIDIKTILPKFAGCDECKIHRPPLVLSSRSSCPDPWFFFFQTPKAYNCST